MSLPLQADWSFSVSSPPASPEGEADPPASPAREQWRAGGGQVETERKNPNYPVNPVGQKSILIAYFMAG